MRRFALALVLLAVATPLPAAYADHDLVVPVVGRTAGGAGRLFLTALWLTNVDDHPASVTLSFLATGHANRQPPSMRVALAPRETRVFDPLGAPLIPEGSGIGGLRIAANADLAASARIYGYVPAEGPRSAVAMAFTGIPARLAIGNGQSALLHGDGTVDARYKLYLVETAGAALSVAVSVEDLHGRARGEKRIFLDRYEHVGANLDELLPGIALDHAIVRVRGVNGNGRVVAAGTQIATGSQDACGYEMSFPAEPRLRIRGPEAAIYAGVALALAIALLRKR